jgi:hypothetical protein
LGLYQCKAHYTTFGHANEGSRECVPLCMNEVWKSTRCRKLGKFLQSGRVYACTDQKYSIGRGGNCLIHRHANMFYHSNTELVLAQQQIEYQMKTRVLTDQSIPWLHSWKQTKASDFHCRERSSFAPPVRSDTKETFMYLCSSPSATFCSKGVICYRSATAQHGYFSALIAGPHVGLEPPNPATLVES